VERQELGLRVLHSENDCGVLDCIVGSVCRSTWCSKDSFCSLSACLRLYSLQVMSLVPVLVASLADFWYIIDAASVPSACIFWRAVPGVQLVVCETIVRSEGVLLITRGTSAKDY
jgi:hypothetical protein